MLILLLTVLFPVKIKLGMFLWDSAYVIMFGNLNCQSITSAPTKLVSANKHCQNSQVFGEA